MKYLPWEAWKGGLWAAIVEAYLTLMSWAPLIAFSGLSFKRECRFILCKLPLFKIRLVTEKFSGIECSLKLLLRPNISTGFAVVVSELLPPFARTEK
ncbi:hypothetical protein V6N12_040727 [Hibiscus sabdariffa]|uniref:Uncharacterized protein n=1 Tax=Hibiscus sabdariffa TaxID=183260 RepID=A0ABR2E6H1_9ROSI